MMYECHNCDTVFIEPLIVYEGHGFTAGPFEKIHVCPSCKVAGMFEEKEVDHEEYLGQSA